jgi:hypothetical protein
VLLAILAACLYFTLDLWLQIRAPARAGPRSPLSSGAQSGRGGDDGATVEDPAAAPGDRSSAATSREEASAVDATLARIEGAASSGEDGSFAIDVPRGHPYEILAVSPQGAPALAMVLPPCRVVLVLAEGGRIAGRAVDRRTGAGVPGVVLALEGEQNNAVGGNPLGRLLDMLDFSASCGSSAVR